jgi:hypothetical protein
MQCCSWHLWTDGPLSRITFQRFIDFAQRKSGPGKSRAPNRRQLKTTESLSRTNKCHLFPTGGHFGTPNKLKKTKHKRTAAPHSGRILEHFKRNKLWPADRKYEPDTRPFSETLKLFIGAATKTGKNSFEIFNESFSSLFNSSRGVFWSARGHCRRSIFDWPVASPTCRSVDD